MSAREVTDAPRRGDRGGKYDAIVCNFANADMVGHTGNSPPRCGRSRRSTTASAGWSRRCASVGGEMLITADHGNAEQMIDEEAGQPHTAHTTNRCRCSTSAPGGLTLRADGALRDVAPTLLQMMGLPQPQEMTGRSLIELAEPRAAARDPPPRTWRRSSSRCAGAGAAATEATPRRRDCPARGRSGLAARPNIDAAKLEETRAARRAGRAARGPRVGGPAHRRPDPAPARPGAAHARPAGPPQGARGGPDEGPREARGGARRPVASAARGYPRRPAGPAPAAAEAGRPGAARRMAGYYRLSLRPAGRTGWRVSARPRRDSTPPKRCCAPRPRAGGPAGPRRRRADRAEGMRDLRRTAVDALAMRLQEQGQTLAGLRR